ncbi:hypothetical protein FHX15_003047 [Rhizobium sp. BK650]|uniref:hypothetical protein n=1 Tax=Rhizobium sp. BK650 TaxID=2586990 RepID=UPI001609E6F0|nr:hypothetical protein [Rhizobium sp. BK650]MBB3657805.1 hypothetical protein [Rhizobium sp. BK650]
MEQYAVDQLKAKARVSRTTPQLSRAERLNRWAELLESDPTRSLVTLRETEYLPRDQRGMMRIAGSPISVAYADPVLRASGLEGDTYGDAQSFFDLSDRQLHGLVCSCHFGAQVDAGVVARHLRAASVTGVKGILARMRLLFTR